MGPAPRVRGRQDGGAVRQGSQRAATVLTKDELRRRVLDKAQRETAKKLASGAFSVRTFRVSYEVEVRSVEPVDAAKQAARLYEMEPGLGYFSVQAIDGRGEPLIRHVERGEKLRKEALPPETFETWEVIGR